MGDNCFFKIITWLAEFAVNTVIDYRNHIGHASGDDVEAVFSVLQRAAVSRFKPDRLLFDANRDFNELALAKFGF